MTSYLPLVQSVPIASSVFENVYQEESNMRKSRTPVINSQVVKLQFQNTAIGGGQSSLDLPQGPLLSHCMIVLSISRDALNAIRAAGTAVFLRKGWGYRAIKNFQILSGGSTQLKIYQRQLMMKALEDCETSTKRDAMLELGGTEYNGAFNLTQDLFAYVHIYLPWSNLSCSRYIPYDSGILTKPISLLFEFSSPTELFSFSSADTALVIPRLPQNFTNKYLMIQTALMALGPSESIRPAVGPNGDSQYNYGWIYPGPFQSDPFTGKPAGPNNTGLRQLIRLDQFQNGNLQSMTIYLERISLGTTPTDILMANTPNNEAMYEDMSNVEIKYGGQTIYRSDNKSNKLMNLSETWVENEVDFSFPQMTNLAIAGVGGIAVNPRKAKWILVNFVQMRESYFKNLVQDGPSVVNNMMSIEFNTPELEDLSNGDPGFIPAPLPASGVPVTQPQYILRASYNYLGSINTYKGFTDFMFLPANAQGPYTMAS